jgi:endo-1,4-beta-xylanase
MLTLSLLVSISLGAIGSADATSQPADAATRPAEVVPALRDLAAARGVLIGTAITVGQMKNPATASLVAREFSCITAENDMKPDSLHRVQGKFTFDRADQYVAFAEAHNMKVIGHTLLWHAQAPKWLFEDEHGKPLPRDAALANLREHIHGVVTHFKGKVHGWDVVNEAIADDPKRLLRDTPALRAIGEDYIVKAFEFAREADPEAELYYNDYNIDADYKRGKAIQLVRQLQQAGVKLDGIGIQGHWMLGGPSIEAIDRGMTELSTLGVPLMITELDIDPLPRRREGGADVSATERDGQNPYKDGLPPEMQTKLADRYRDVFGVLLKHPQVKRITFWGFHDGGTWLNDWPVRGRTNHPLLWDRELRPKPARDAVAEALRDVPKPANAK